MKDVKLYKILHRPSGLYYRPGSVNLTERGKTYLNKPTVKHISLNYIKVADKYLQLMSEKGIEVERRGYCNTIESKAEDFEIVEI